MTLGVKKGIEAEKVVEAFPYHEVAFGRENVAEAAVEALLLLGDNEVVNKLELE